MAAGAKYCGTIVSGIGASLNNFDVHAELLARGFTPIGRAVEVGKPTLITVDHHAKLVRNFECAVEPVRK